MNGVVPVADLARVYALIGQLTAVNTRARLEAAAEAGVISASGARDLIEAYDLIAADPAGTSGARVRAGEQARQLPRARPICRISNAATCAMPSSSCAPCNPPSATAAARWDLKGQAAMAMELYRGHGGGRCWSFWHACLRRDRPVSRAGRAAALG